MGAIWQRKGIRTLLMAFPFLLVAIPSVYAATVSLLPLRGREQVPQAVLSLLAPEVAALNCRQAWFEAFTTLLCPLLFLMVPVISGVALASYVFVGEKEAGTLETMLLTSMDARSVFSAKVSFCSLLSILISLISFVAFSIAVSVADLMLEAPFFFNFQWLVLLLFLMPALSFFAVCFISLIIPRVHSTGESLQLIGYLLLPFVILFLAQFSGAFPINALFLLFLSVMIAILAIILFNASLRRFQAERLLDRPVEGK